MADRQIPFLPLLLNLRGLCFVYLINTWIPRLPIVVAIFTGIFIVTYAIVWLTVYLCVRAHAKRLNARL